MGSLGLKTFCCSVLTACIVVVVVVSNLCFRLLSIDVSGASRVFILPLEFDGVVYAMLNHPG